MSKCLTFGKKANITETKYILPFPNTFYKYAWNSSAFCVKWDGPIAYRAILCPPHACPGKMIWIKIDPLLMFGTQE